MRLLRLIRYRRAPGVNIGFHGPSPGGGNFLGGGAMTTFLFSAQGRINRAKFWSYLLYYIGSAIILGLVYFVLSLIIPLPMAESGAPQLAGVTAIPYVIVGVVYFVGLLWSGICVGVKRFHDRDKSGWWILIQFVPLIGPIWYFIEAGCLRGTIGANRFGPDPLAN
jgi:uncharacterized membrane protein YhaH (DUF805 family)